MGGDETYGNNSKNNIISLWSIGFVAGIARCGIAFVALNPVFIVGRAVLLSWLDTAA